MACAELATRPAAQVGGRRSTGIIDAEIGSSGRMVTTVISLYRPITLKRLASFHLCNAEFTSGRTPLIPETQNPAT